MEHASRAGVLAPGARPQARRRPDEADAEVPPGGDPGFVVGSAAGVVGGGGGADPGAPRRRGAELPAAAGRGVPRRVQAGVPALAPSPGRQGPVLRAAAGAGAARAVAVHAGVPPLHGRDPVEGAGPGAAQLARHPGHAVPRPRLPARVRLRGRPCCRRRRGRARGLRRAGLRHGLPAAPRAPVRRVPEQVGRDGADAGGAVLLRRRRHRRPRVRRGRVQRGPVRAELRRGARPRWRRRVAAGRQHGGQHGVGRLRRARRQAVRDRGVRVALLLGAEGPGVRPEGGPVGGDAGGDAGRVDGAERRRRGTPVRRLGVREDEGQGVRPGDGLVGHGRRRPHARAHHEALLGELRRQ